MTSDAAQPIIFPEYVEGEEVRLSLDSSGETATVVCKIAKAYRPFTMSPVLLIFIAQPPTFSQGGPSIPSTAIVKLYDRRCFTNVRTEFDEGKPWSLDKEKEYRQYLDDVAAGSAALGDFGNPAYFWENDVSDGEFEAYLSYVALKTFDAERASYERLRELQGKMLPTLYGVVEYQAVVPDPRDHGASITETVPGLLLEYVEGLSLRELVATWRTRDPPLPDTVLAALCDEAVRVVDRVSDFEVLNEDMRVDNFLVREEFLASSTSTYVHSTDASTVNASGGVVLIDLGQCRLRRADESEDEWVQAKWSQDETGAIGFVLLRLMREFVGEDVWTYERSLRYYRPLEG
ncbi:hypothetical protein C8Q77DRAFT_1219273 [Trametes polyzona]|nr:hypothetical protein C8Q77DRAFT_1219273 [Trametes polyzona]